MDKRPIFASLTPYQRICPWTPLGDPRIRPDLLLGARHGPLWEILDPPLTCMLQSNTSGIYYVFTVNCGTERAQSFFWRDKNEADQSDPTKLEVRRRLAGSWSSISELCR